MLHPILLQTMYYMVVVVLSLFILGFIQRGFFWKFLKVKMSFGRLILVKVRGLTRDFYSIGEVEESFLVFKTHKSKKRIIVKNKSNKESESESKGDIIKKEIKTNTVFYRSLGVIWVDYDENTGALSRTDYSGIEGFDPVKFEELYTRALFKPAISDDRTKVIFTILAVLIILTIISIYLGYKNGQGLQTVYQKVAEAVEVNKGIIIGAKTI